MEFSANSRLIGDDDDGSDGWSVTWDATSKEAGYYSLQATAFDSVGQSDRQTVTVLVGSSVQGDWVGSYGADGYALLGWYGNADVLALTQASLSLDQGSRFA